MTYDFGDEYSPRTSSNQSDAKFKNWMRKEEDIQLDNAKKFRFLIPIPEINFEDGLFDRFYSEHEKIMSLGIPSEGRPIFFYGTTKLGFDKELYTSFVVIKDSFIMNQAKEYYNVFDFSKVPNDPEFDKYVQDNGIEKIAKNKTEGISFKENNQLVIHPITKIPSMHIDGFIINNFHGMYDSFINNSDIAKIYRVYNDHKKVTDIVKLK